MNVAFQIRKPDQERIRIFVEAGVKPSIHLWELLATGLQLPGKRRVDPELIGSLIQLDAGDRQEYWLGLHNFYVITRYNHSNLYAMAAFQLSREIAMAKQGSEVSSDR